MEKKFVDVICEMNQNGLVKPIYLIWEKNKRIPIIQIKEIKPKAQIEYGASGLRYTCIFSPNIEKHLYFDRGKWYVELMV